MTVPNGEELYQSKATNTVTATIHELAGTDLLRNSPESVLTRVASHATLLLLAAGEVLLTPERDNACVYLLISGALAVHFDTPDSPAIRQVAPGETVGEMSVIDRARPSAYVIAKENCRLFTIHRDLIHQIVADTNSVAGNLLRLLTKRLNENTQRIVQDRWQIEELTDHANVDGLTRLYNRRWLDNALARWVEQSIKGHQPLCVLLLDVDHFKQYNDAHGHQGGDQALIAISNMLKTAVRPYDFATRYGGEEFLVLLPNTCLAEAVTIAERLRAAAQAMAIFSTTGASLPGLTLSIGVAVNDARSTPDSLVAAADEKLYLAKKECRNCVRY